MMRIEIVSAPGGGPVWNVIGDDGQKLVSTGSYSLAVKVYQAHVIADCIAGRNLPEEAVLAILETHVIPPETYAELIFDNRYKMYL